MNAPRSQKLYSNYKDTVKSYNGNYRIEQRRKRLMMPLYFEGLEIGIIWLILAIFNVTFDAKLWHPVAIGILLAGILYCTHKTIKIFDRQVDYPTPTSAA